MKLEQISQLLDHSVLKCQIPEFFPQLVRHVLLTAV